HRITRLPGLRDRLCLGARKEQYRVPTAAALSTAPKRRPNGFMYQLEKGPRQVTGPRMEILKKAGPHGLAFAPSQGRRSFASELQERWPADSSIRTLSI